MMSTLNNWINEFRREVVKWDNYLGNKKKTKLPDSDLSTLMFMPPDQGALLACLRTMNSLDRTPLPEKTLKVIVLFTLGSLSKEVAIKQNIFEVYYGVQADKTSGQAIELIRGIRWFLENDPSRDWDDLDTLSFTIDRSKEKERDELLNNGLFD